jgi:excisionase family DNA binding protein
MPPIPSDQVSPRGTCASALLYRIEPDTTEALGLSRSKVYHLIADGELETVHLGPRAVRVTTASIHAYIERQRRAEPANKLKARSASRELLERALARRDGKPWKRGRAAKVAPRTSSSKTARPHGRANAKTASEAPQHP